MDQPRLLGDRYEVGELLGRGGMAEVHSGRDLRLGRTVAIKSLRVDLARDPSFQNRFRREAQSAASLNHPNIVAIYDTGEEVVDGASGEVVPYLVMEAVEGTTLRTLLNSGRKLLPERALEITAGVLAALDYSHRHGIVHRDIKPANVMLTNNGEIKVMDFGIARAIADPASTMTQTGATLGTAQHGEGENPHAWFTAFAPAGNPKVAVAVIVEDGGGDSEATGGQVAAPIARQVIEAVLR